MILCDFCSGPNPTRCFRAVSFVVHAAHGSVSDGDWAACDECSALIDAGDWEGLAQYSVQAFLERHLRTEWFMPDVREALLTKLLAIHDEFRRARM